MKELPESLGAVAPQQPRQVAICPSKTEPMWPPRVATWNCPVVPDSAEDRHAGMGDRSAVAVTSLHPRHGGAAPADIPPAPAGAAGSRMELLREAKLSPLKIAQWNFPLKKKKTKKSCFLLTKGL